MAYPTEARKVVSAALAYRGGFDSLTLSGDLVLTPKHAQRLRIDPTAARNVDLPGIAGDYLQNGEFFEIVNVGSGSEDLTVRQPGAGATVTTITPGDKAVLYYNGSAWALHYLDVGGYA